MPQSSALCELLLELYRHSLSTADHDVSVSWWSSDSAGLNPWVAIPFRGGVERPFHRGRLSPSENTDLRSRVKGCLVRKAEDAAPVCVLLRQRACEDGAGWHMLELASHLSALCL